MYRGATPLAGFAKRLIHVSATFTFIKKVSREKSNLDLDWTCRDLDEVESASE